MLSNFLMHTFLLNIVWIEWSSHFIIILKLKALSSDKEMY